MPKRTQLPASSPNRSSGVNGLPWPLFVFPSNRTNIVLRSFSRRVTHPSLDPDISPGPPMRTRYFLLPPHDSPIHPCYITIIAIDPFPSPPPPPALISHAFVCVCVCFLSVIPQPIIIACCLSVRVRSTFCSGGMSRVCLSRPARVAFRPPHRSNMTTLAISAGITNIGNHRRRGRRWLFDFLLVRVLCFNLFSFRSINQSINVRARAVGGVQ